MLAARWEFSHSLDPKRTLAIAEIGMIRHPLSLGSLPASPSSS